jgi:hypothetical protein
MQVKGVENRIEKSFKNFLFNELSFDLLVFRKAM